MVSQKSIILIPFPFSDLSGQKIRPALIISNSRFNENNDAIIICALTSKIKKNRPYAIDITPAQTITKTLKDRSQIRVDTLAKIKKDLIIKEIDIVGEKTFQKVIRTLNSIFL